MIGYVVYAGATYALPKVLDHLSTEPDDPHSQDLFDRIRRVMHELQHSVREAIGERYWFLVSDVLADNL